ncbi:XylR family transcriptional regulator [Massilia sp. PWRC2]|uniref:XylR family transcriptional regulator n=1 Tax=Massilia sp. PWRC2 TaxID=2804626 RepID=UPI003CF723D0
MSTPPTHRVALLFNANKIFDRDVIAGIASHLASTRAHWDVFLEEDFRLRLAGIEHWQGDGIIADFDDPSVAAALARSPLPVVAVGASYAAAADYPAGVPYVATDNARLVEVAYQHLVEAGLVRFAMFSLPASAGARWAQEREQAFCALLRRDNLATDIYRGHSTSAASWQDASEQQIAWLRALPKPIGIIAVTDARARQLLQGCSLAGIAVPEQVALVGIDNDPLAHMLARIPLTSVIQGGQEIGRRAARLLDQMLHGAHPGALRLLVPPAGINAQASSRHQPARHPHVMRARHFIRQYACQGIKTGQVADYVGISRSCLEAHFRQEQQCSVHDEILRFKLEAATSLLAAADANIAEVALRCGFTSVQYMHAVFKRELGCTPRAWQDRERRHGAASA